MVKEPCWVAYPNLHSCELMDPGPSVKIAFKILKIGKKANLKKYRPGPGPKKYNLGIASSGSIRTLQRQYTENSKK
jgi:hypothetical protein